MELTGFEAPTRSIVSWADYGTALHAAFGTWRPFTIGPKRARGS